MVTERHYQVVERQLSVVERQFQVVERQTQVAERRSAPFRLNLTTAQNPTGCRSLTITCFQCSSA